MRLALFEPDIPQNTGTLLRLSSCFGIKVDIIEPCGFIFEDKRMRRAGMDYLDLVDVTRHESWEHFYQSRLGRIVLLTTKTTQSYTDVAYDSNDILLLGRESAGVPETVHQSVDVQVRIPMQAHTRSLNVALAGALVLGEALRQTGHFKTLV